MLVIMCLSLMSLLFILWIRWRIQKFSLFKSLGIPGPPPSILFGNVLEMVRKDPHSCFQEWSERYGEVLGYYYGSWPVLLITSPEYVTQVLIRNFSIFTDRPLDLLGFEIDDKGNTSTHHMANLKGEKWKEVRAMLRTSFTSGKLREMMPFMDDCSTMMLLKLEKLCGNGTKDIEMYSLYQRMALDIVGKCVFGIETSVQQDPNHPLLRFFNMIVSAKFKSFLSVLVLSFKEFQFVIYFIRKVVYRIYGGGKRPIAEMLSMCADVVRTRREAPSHRRTDLLQSLIDALSTEDISDQALTATAQSTTDENTGPASHSKSARRLNDKEVLANAFMFFMVGYETTSTALAYLTHHLVNNPDVQDKLRKEIQISVGKDRPVNYEDVIQMSFLDRVIMESLRLNSPTYNFTNRVASCDFQLGKWTVPAGMTIQVPHSALHQNPKYFHHPHLFIPDRFLSENRGSDHSVTWIPFGAGPRNCIGMRFAILEIKLTIINLLQKFRLEPSVKTERGLPKLSFNVGFVHPANGVHLRVIPI